MSETIRLALTGQPLSGKSTAGVYLWEQWGFQPFSGSDFLKTEAAKVGGHLRERGDYGNFQRQLRIVRGLAMITDEVFALPHERVQNVGIRNRYDVDAHIERGGAIIAFICPRPIRFERRPLDDPKYPDTYEAFVAAEAPEYNDPDPLGQHTDYAIDQAQYVLDTVQPWRVTKEALDMIVKLEVCRAQKV